MSLRSHRLVTVLFFGLSTLVAAPTAPGIDNFRQVDQSVYRGAQPTEAGFKYLASLGVKVVLDLREHDERSVAEEQAVKAAGMRYVNVPMTGLTPPSETETKTVLALLENSESGPVFVHCKRGADRTGAVIAAYRIDHDKWDNSKALKEAMDSGMSHLQFPRQKYIRAFHPATVETADVAASSSSTLHQ